MSVQLFWEVARRLQARVILQDKLFFLSLTLDIKNMTKGVGLLSTAKMLSTDFVHATKTATQHKRHLYANMHCGIYTKTITDERLPPQKLQM